MNRNLLIDNLIQQTMVLIAQLATSGGTRAPLAQVADRVFVELAKELDAKGLSRKVSADMFGMALRSYRRRLQRLSESQTEQGRSLWTALLDYLQQHSVVMRHDILAKFHRDDEAQIRGILNDLTESGLVFQIGRGAQTAYRAASTEELSAVERNSDGYAEFVWLLIYREGPLSREQVADKAPADDEALTQTLESLVDSDRIQLDAQGRYLSKEIVVARDAPSGWEAAMLDHFRAVVVTLCQRLRSDCRDEVGGSTYSFDVWPEHPLAEDVYGHLRQQRNILSELRRRVENYNHNHGIDGQHEQVTIYVGQNIIDPSAT